MPDYSDQQADLFVVEPVTQLDGSPAPQPGRLSEATWRERLGPPGMIALAEGVALLLCFFAPWFYFPDSSRSLDIIPLKLTNYSGLGAALGILFGANERVAFFVHLWLIPVTAVALLAVACVYGQRRFSTRLTLGSAVALSVLALLVEAGFYAQVLLLKPVLYGGTSPSVDFMGVAWGFWVAVAVNLIAVAACVYQLRTSRVSPAPAEPASA